MRTDTRLLARIVQATYKHMRCFTSTGIGNLSEHEVSYDRGRRSRDARRISRHKRERAQQSARRHGIAFTLADVFGCTVRIGEPDA